MIDRGGLPPKIMLLVWTTLVTVSAAPNAHAGTKTQGTKTQGTKTQGTKTQGTKTQGTKTQGTKTQGTKTQGNRLSRAVSPGTPRVDEWLWGTRLYGVIPDAAGAGYQLVDVIGFRGDSVDVMAWRADTGWRRAERSPESLVGMRWLEHRCRLNRSCPRVEYRIRAVTRDRSRTTMPAYPDNEHNVWLYNIESTARTNKDASKPTRWTPVCGPDADGVAGGLFVDGFWKKDGSWRAAGYTFSCPSGVVAKCARGWGYKPWQRLRSASGKRVALAPLHRACVRAARADYCGDGISYTRDGTRIDMFDQYGFNIPERPAGFTPEAAFSEHGAAWMERLRHGWPGCAGRLARTRKASRAAGGGAQSRPGSLVTVWSRTPHER